MQDKYYHTSDTLATVIAALGLDAETVIIGCDGNYFQTPDFILLWVGKIPLTYDEDGNALTYAADGANHFNVRPINAYPDLTAVSAMEVAPNTPYSIFA